MAITRNTLILCYIMLFICITKWPNHNNNAEALRTMSNATSSFTPNQTGDFWVSDAGNYTFGFKDISLTSTSQDPDYLLCIWRTGDINKTAIWWPKSAPTVNNGGHVNFSKTNGVLQLFSSSSFLLWNSSSVAGNGSSSSSNYTLSFQSYGDLQILTENNIISWRSFGLLTDTVPLEAVISEPKYIAENKLSMIQSTSNSSSYSVGKYYLEVQATFVIVLHGIDAFNNEFAYNYGFLNLSDGVPVDARFYNPNPLVDRLAIDADDGNLKVYRWLSNTSTWKQIWKYIDNICLSGSPCGPYGICTPVENSTNYNCSCPLGFYMRDEKNPLLGCGLTGQLNQSLTDVQETLCSFGNASIHEVAYVDYDFNDINHYSNISLDECKSHCLSNCTCLAAVYGSDNGPDGPFNCYIKGGSDKGYLMNGYFNENRTLLLRNLIPGNSGNSDNGSISRGALIGIIIGAIVLILIILGLVALFYILSMRRRCKDRDAGNFVQVMESVIRFTYRELAMATNNFSEPLGEGEFGVAYKGWMKKNRNKASLVSKTSSFKAMEKMTMKKNSENYQAVVVRVVRSSALVELARNNNGSNNNNDLIQDQEMKIFGAELSTLAKIHHVNLIRLIGYYAASSHDIEETKTSKSSNILTKFTCYIANCIIKPKPNVNKHGDGDGDSCRFMLVYEYMANGSLQKLLDKIAELPIVSWQTWYEVALGTARGIAYLHHDCSPRILHCNIKPQNVLLDADFKPKVTDFGFSRRFDHSHVSMSTLGGLKSGGDLSYVAPERLTDGYVTPKSDMFSFGMLLLALVQAVVKDSDNSNASIVEWAIKFVSRMGNVSGNTNSDNGEDLLEKNQKVLLVRIGLLCVNSDYLLRPDMSRVVQLIDEGCTIDGLVGVRFGNLYNQIDDKMISTINIVGDKKAEMPYSGLESSSILSPR